MSRKTDKALRRWRRFLDEHRKLIELGAGPEHLAEHRRARTRLDPMLFALVYLSRHLADPATGKVTLSDVHVAWAKSARSWSTPVEGPQQDRRAEVAPREMGKSTWWFLLLPMWASAHGHVRFAAAFADTDTQAQTHLASFKAELDANVLIRNDFPDLVAPKTRGRGTVEADRVSLYHSRSGFVFAAAGMDSSNLGMKVGDRRPDLLILDDIEPHEGRYSSELAEKRLNTLRQAILPLNVRARVVLVGTVTMHGSIVHQVVRRSHGEESEENDWVAEEKIKARHFRPFVTGDDGERASIWPEKWPLEFLEAMEHTRSFKLNYENDPLGADGAFWTADDFRREELPGATRILVSIDPAVTTKKTSDWTGIAVVAWRPAPTGTRGPGKCIVLEAKQVRMDGAALRLEVLKTIERTGAGLVLVETNQGGDLWTQILWGLPVRIKTIHQTIAKEVRAAAALNEYQRGRVLHHPAAKLTDAEGQMVAFPRAPHDDMVDAISAAVRYYLIREKPRRGITVEQANYA